MEPTPSQVHDRERTRLLEQGTPLYMDAVMAIREYRKEVHDRCRKIFEDQIADYASALGIEISSSELREHAYPTIDQWDGKYWELGAKISRNPFITGFRWWEAHCSLSYNLLEDRVHCWFGEWFPNKPITDSVFRAFRGENSSISVEKTCVSIHRTLKREELGTFEVYLGETFQQWITIWRKIGGIKAIKADGE